MALANKFGLFQKQLGGLEGVGAPGQFCNFYPHLSLEAVFAAPKLTQNCCVNINIFFRKTGNLIVNWVPPCSTNILCLKDYPDNLTKYEIMGPSKIPISQLSKLRKIWKCSLDLYSKNPVFHFLHELKKID